MDRWVRITVYLPVFSVAERTAFDRVLSFLRERPAGLTGFTYTTPFLPIPTPPPWGQSISTDALINELPIHVGLWWDEHRRQMVLDWIALVHLDIPRQGRVSELVALIKNQALAVYTEEGSPQQVIWCTVQPIWVA